MKGESRYTKYGSIVIALITVLTVFSVMGGASAQPVQSTSSGVQVVTETLHINMNDVRYVSGPSGHYLIVKGLRLTGNPGTPAVPVKSMKFKLPAGARITSVKLTTGSPVYFGDYKLSPAVAPVLKDGYAIPAKYAPPTMNREIYGSSAPYPAKNMIYRVENNGLNTYVYVYLFPVKYSPASGKVWVYRDMKVEVSYHVVNVRERAVPVNAINLIITSPELKQQAQRLANFHNSTGVTSFVVTTNWIAKHYSPAANPPLNGYGNSTTDPYGAFGNATLPLKKDMIVGYNYTLARQIIAFLQNETGGPRYITIFGNARMVPPSYYYLDQEFYLLAYLGYGDYYDAWIPTDAMYASPNYNSTSFSYTPTFMVGRLPVDNSTARYVVDKIIYYATTKTKGIQNVTLSGGQVFETPYFLGETGVLEPLNYGWLNGLNVTEYFHTLRNFTYNNFERMMYHSDMIVEITHGSGFSFWHHNDEVSAWDFPLKTAYGSLPIYISGSCLNGAWDEGMYPSYEMSSGLNGGTSIAEQMLYSPKGIIAYFGADREALGSTYAYFDNGTLIAPNDYGDLITEDGTVAGYYIGTHYHGYATIGMMGYYAKALYDMWIPFLDQRDAARDGLNDNPWGRSYFEYSVLGDPALQVAGSGANNPYYTQPKVKIVEPPNDTGNEEAPPSVDRGTTVELRINTTASTNTTVPKLKVELLYLEQDYGSSPYGSAQLYYDFVLSERTLSPVSHFNRTYNFTYSFTPYREGMYIVSVYTPDGKNTRLYISCDMPFAPPVHISLKSKKFMEPITHMMPGNTRAAAPDVQVVTLIDNEQLMYNKTTNVTAILYNAGNAPAENVNVSFYLENYTLVFQSRNLSHPLVALGYKVVPSIPAGGVAYVTIPWKAYNLWLLNHSWDPLNSSSRWQYLVASAYVAGDAVPSNNANWALFRVHLKLDVWAQKMFIEKDPVLNQQNKITIELTNVGTSYTSDTTIIVGDDYTNVSNGTNIIRKINNVHIAPGQTVFYTVTWTPKHPGIDHLFFIATSSGDNNTMNNKGWYYSNGYYGITSFTVLTYDVAVVDMKAVETGNSTKIGVELYNYGPLASKGNTTVYVSLYSNVTALDVKSPSPYPDMYNHTWEIDAPKGSHGIALHFGYLMVEPGYDYVYIYNSSMKLVAAYTGFYADIWSPYIPGDKVYVRLVSDEYVHYAGFYIDSMATNYVYVGNITYGSIANGSFAQKTIVYNGSIVGRLAAVMARADVPGEYGTMSTGNASNNVLASTVDRLYVIGHSSSIMNNRDAGLQITFYYSYRIFGIEPAVAYASVDGIAIPEYRVSYSNTSMGINYGNVSVMPPFLLADGEHEVSVLLVDGLGDSVWVNWTFTVDATPPVLELSTPTNVPMAGSNTLTIAGTTEPDAKLTINGVSVTVNSDGSFSYTAHLSDGFNVFVVKATDPAGNSAVVRVTALYLPELNEIMANITELYKELGNLSAVVSTLHTDVASLQAKVDALSAQLTALQNALNENVTMLEKAIKDNNTQLMHIINNNITAINDEISTIKEQKLPALKNDIQNAEAKNSEQDGAIGTSNLLGILGILIGLVALLLAFINMRKKTPVMPAPSVPEEHEEVTLEEDEDLEEI